MPRPDRAPERVVRALEALENARPLDRVAAAVDRLAAPLRGTAGEVLRGAWFGHALHPLLTDIPIGLWPGAHLIALSGRHHLRATATTFMALGTAAAAPTLASGLAEWHTLPASARRTGAAHAALNIAAMALYATSTGARLARRHTTGALLGYAGTTVATAAGYLGGHLATAHRLGTVDPRLERPT